MPHARQYRVIAVFILLVFLTIYYAIMGARQTRQAPMYKKTVAAIQTRKADAARQAMLDDEHHRQDRVERLRKEHDVAVSTSTPLLTTSETEPAVPMAGAALAGAGAQQPIGGAVGGHPGVVAGAAGDVEGEKNVAGRVKVKDDRPQKATTDMADGVAKIGNVGSKETDVVKGDKSKPETQEEHKVETVLNDILKKGPIIVFSKTYCPHSRKAKHILQDLYTIDPEPYVVELDEHELGPQLQSALQESTGRRTVPNVLINGKSIGGGDDIYDLHIYGKLIDKIKSMGGKRIVSVVANPEDAVKADAVPKKEVKFKA